MKQKHDQPTGAIRRRSFLKSTGLGMMGVAGMGTLTSALHAPDEKVIQRSREERLLQMASNSYAVNRLFKRRPYGSRPERPETTALKEKYGEDAKAILTVLERTKFRDIVKPGDTLTYTTEIMSVNKNGGKVSTSASLDNKTVVTTGMVFAFKYIDDPMLESKREALKKIWMS